MIRVSKFYSNKTNSERKLKVLEDIINCEKLLRSDNFSIIGGGIVSAAELGATFSDIKLSPSLSNVLWEDIRKALTGYLVTLHLLNDQIDKERKN